MVKFSGLVGYGAQVETYPGVWETEDKEILMRGDLIRQNANINNEPVNADINLKNRISLIGNAYAFDNWFNMKWIELDGQKWKIQSVEVQRPRLIVEVGGVWND